LAVVQHERTGGEPENGGKPPNWSSRAKEEVMAPPDEVVTPVDLGIAAFAGASSDAFLPVVPRGTRCTTPEPLRVLLRPTQEGQTLVRLRIHAGEGPRVSGTSCMGVIELGLSKGLAADALVELAFSLPSLQDLAVELRVPGEPGCPRTWRFALHWPDAEDRRWAEDLAAAVQTATWFRGAYDPFLRPDERARPEDLAARAEAALGTADRPAGDHVQRALLTAVLGSETASVLFLGERALVLLAPEKAMGLARALSALRSAHLAGESDKTAAWPGRSAT
jgi:hypothetical protein